MRIAHIVTFASADGAFGGPTRVALSQAAEQARLGHFVTVYAGSPANEAGDRMIDGYRLRTFPVRKVAPFGGFATLWPKQLLRALRANVSFIDIAHVHLARDLVTLPAAIYLGRSGVPYVTQTHGMIDASSKALAKIVDVVATRRALARASCWLLLTPGEIDDLSALAKPGNVHQIRNGIESPTSEFTPLDSRPDTVLFLARLQERKRPLAFVEVAKVLASKLPNTKFVLIGPDEGEGEAVVNAIEDARLGDRLKWLGAIGPEHTMDAMRSAKVYLLPAVNEVFPMSILESFAAGTPVVTTDSLGIADDCIRYGAAIITDGSVDELAEATWRAHEDALLADQLRAGARTYLNAELGIDQVASEIIEIYGQATNSHGSVKREKNNPRMESET